MEGIYPQVNWLQGLAMTTLEDQLFRADPVEQDLLQQGSGPCWVYPLRVSLVEEVGWCFDVSWSCLLVPWLWGLLGGQLPTALHWDTDISYKAICRWLLFVLGLEMPRRGQAANHSRLLLVLGLRPLSKMYVAHWPDAACLRDFRKIQSMSQDSPFVWKRHWKWFGLGLQVGWGRISGNHQGRVNSMSQVDVVSDMVPACQLFVGRALPALLSWRKLLLQLLPQCQTTQFLFIHP